VRLKVFIALAVTFIGASMSSFALAMPFDECATILDRKTVSMTLGLHSKALTFSPSSAQSMHLQENEKIALKMAEQVRQVLPSRKALKTALDPYIQELTEQKMLVHRITVMFLIEMPYPTDLIVDVLNRVRDSDVAEDLISAVKNKSLSISKMFDLSIRWAITMTVIESIQKGTKFKFTDRESLRLWECLVGQCDTFVRLFPVAYYRFHQGGLSIESTVGMTSRPIFPMQLSMQTIHHEAEDESMRPIETLIHDMFHAEQRMRQSYSWLFDSSVSDYFPAVAKVKRKQAPMERQFSFTDEHLARVLAHLTQQEKFHHFVFTKYKRAPEKVQAGAELIWFYLYFAEKYANGEMTAAQLKVSAREFEEDPFKLKTIANEAKTGGLGTRYTQVDKESLLRAASLLRTLADEY
jgi:hypothetical protein